jgi:hypothetical protein
MLAGMRKLCAAAALAFSGGAMAAEAVLVHDIAPPHPRYTQLAQRGGAHLRRRALLDAFGESRLAS